MAPLSLGKHSFVKSRLRRAVHDNRLQRTVMHDRRGTAILSVRGALDSATRGRCTATLDGNHQAGSAVGR